MASPQDEKLAGLVVRDGVMTPAQLEECRRIQARLSPPRSLAQIIVARHYATADQLRDLVAKEVSKRTTARPAAVLPAEGPSDLEREDVEIGRKLIARGLLDEARVRECLALTRRAREQKPDVRFAQVVLKKEYVSRDALRELLLELPTVAGRMPAARATAMRPAFDASSLEGSGPFAPMRPATPPTARPRTGPTGTPPNAFPRAPVASWANNAESQTVPASALFGSPSAGPQPLFGEASGVVQPMFGLEGSSSQASALPFRGSSARLVPPRSTSAARPVAPAFLDAPPPPPPPKAGRLPSDPWNPALQPEPFPRDPARGNFQTVELDPGDPALPQVARSAGGDPYGEGRLDSKDFEVGFDSVRVKGPSEGFDTPPPFVAPGPGFDAFGSAEPIGLGKNSSGTADLRRQPPSWGNTAAAGPSDGFGPPPSLGFAGPAIDLGSAGFGGDPFKGPGSLAGASEPDLPAEELGLAAPQGDPGLATDLPSDAPTDSVDESKVANKPLGRRTRRDVTASEREGERPRSSMRWVVLAVVIVLLGGGIFAVVKVVSDRMAVQQAERSFVDALHAPPKDRDPRAALKLGDALPDSSKIKPELREALNALRTEVALLDAKEEAAKIISEITDEMPAQARLEAAEKAIHKDPQCARAFLERARARVALGRQKGTKALGAARSAAATEDLPIATGLDPKLLDAYWELANLQELSATGRDQMRIQLERVRDGDKDGFMGLLAAGRLRALDRDPKAVPEALSFFSRAVDAKPESALPHLVRGRFRLATNRPEGALGDANQAVELTKSRSPEALVLRAWARRVVSGDLTNAKADLERALSIESSYAPAFGQRALARWDGGDARGAEEDVRSALQIDEGEPTALLAQALLLAVPRPGSLQFVTDTRKLGDARKVLRQAMERDDRLLPAILLHGRLALNDSDQEGAMRDFNHVIDIDPNSAPALANRGQIYIQRREFAEARRDLDRAIDLDPKDERALFNRAKLGIEGEPRNFEGAISDLTKALSVSSEFAEAYYYRGVAYYETGHLTEAVDDETTAIQKGDKAFLQKHAHEAYYVRGMAHYARSRWADAIADLQEAEKRAPPGAAVLAKIKSFLSDARSKQEAAQQKDQAPPPAKETPNDPPK